MNSKIISKGNEGFLKVITQEKVNQDFKWKVDLIYIQRNFNQSLVGCSSEVKQ